MYQLTSFKLDKAIQSRIDSDAETKAQLIDIIKKGINNDKEEKFSDVITSDPTEDLSMQTTSSSPSNMIIGIVAAIILLLLMFLLFVVIRNQKKGPVYLKPKTELPDNTGTATKRPTETLANENSDVKRSELNSLRQSAVSMSVGQKDGATQIVKDWLNTDGGGEDSEESDEEA